jgi:hypothetical protein
MTPRQTNLQQQSDFMQRPVAREASGGVFRKYNTLEKKTAYKKTEETCWSMCDVTVVVPQIDVILATFSHMPHVNSYLAGPIQGRFC